MPVMTLGSSFCETSERLVSGGLGAVYRRVKVTLRVFWRMLVEREIPRTDPVARKRYETPAEGREVSFTQNERVQQTHSRRPCQRERRQR